MSSRAAAPARARITGRAVALVVLVVLLVLGSVGVVRRFAEQRAEIGRLERRLAGLTEERAALARRIEQLHDPEHLERLARECLGMVAPGEIAFVVPSQDAPPRC